MKQSGGKEGNGGDSPSRLIDARIDALDDWRGEMLAWVRKLIRQALETPPARRGRSQGGGGPSPDTARQEQAEPGVVEEVKWRKPSNSMLGVPVWSHNGIICTGEVYKDKVKLTFAKGASAPDPAGLFNAGLDGKTRRAIDLREGDRIDEKAFKALIRAAAALNASGRAGGRRDRVPKKPKDH